MLFRIALANIRFPATPAESVELVEQAVDEAGVAKAEIICFPEAFVPGYRLLGKQVPPPDEKFLEQAWTAVGATAKRANVGVILGTERIVDERLRITALVINRDGSFAGFQDKVQLDPSEDSTYAPGAHRQLFHAGQVAFGVVICHEGWRYPETVRWAAQRGAQIVFHPQFDVAAPGRYQPSTFADPANSFHEKAALCRAAENTCFFATVNCASDGAPITSAVVGPDGRLVCFQPYGKEGLLLANLDLSAATGLLASRFKPL